MQCECLFCQEQAKYRLTVPHHKPRTLLCDEHLCTQLEWASRYRKVPGMVVVETATLPVN